MFNWLTFIGGAILGVFLQRVVDELIKPDIKIELGHEAFIPSTGTPQHKFLHVIVKNNKRNFFLRLVLSNPTSNNARVWISFLDYVSKSEIFKINGRWTTKREPVNYQTNQPDLGEVLIVPREIIPAGEEVPVSIAVKEAKQKECFAFNNESYLHNKWQNPDFVLPEKRYIARVKVSSEGKEWVKDFLLLNPGISLKNFDLKNLS